MSTSAISKKSSVAPQQKACVDFEKLNNEQLHHEMLDARNEFYQHCTKAHAYAVDVLIPACEAIITRYKMQGVAAKDRPNGKPTLETYFRSIDLNYNTVRSWIHRKRLQTEMFQTKKRTDGKKGDNKIRHLTELEARLLGTASAGHDLVKAIQNGGNLDAAVKVFKEQAPTPERIEEYIERPVDGAADRLSGLAPKKLAKALMDEIARLVRESGNGERVSIFGEGETPISYDRDNHCYTFTVLVQKQEATEVQPPELTNAAAGGRQ